MRVNRALLYSGVFLVALGGVLVTADLVDVDTAAWAEALRLWPLAIIAIGLGLVLRRTPAALPLGMLAAAVPGLVLGGALVVGPRFVGDCGLAGEPGPVATERGSFSGPATVSVTTGCGSLTVRTVTGSDWQLGVDSTRSRMPAISESARSLVIESVGDADWHAFAEGRDTWDLTLPRSAYDALSITVQAGRGDVDLAGADIARLAIEASASEVVVDASDATVGELSAEVNVGMLSIVLSAGSDLVGSLGVGAGAIELCTPADLGLRITSDAFAGDVRVNGLDQIGTSWQSPGYTTAAHRADLTVNVDFGSIEINPIGGCK